MTTTQSKLEWLAKEARLQQARDAAEEIVVRTRLTAPVDPLSIAADERAMLRVRGGDFRNRFDGQLEYHLAKRRFILFYNTKYDAGLPPGKRHARTRFSIAHELGHYFLERHHAHFLKGGAPHPSRGEFISDVEMELEADAFASGLLLPTCLVRPVVNEEELSLRRVEEIAADFETSLVSTMLRSVQLSDFACAVVGIQDGAIAWGFRSQALIDAGLYPPARGGAGSPLCDEQWADFQAGCAERAAGSAFTGQWFRTYERDELDGLHVDEHYLPVFSMGTLLVLLSVPEDEIPLKDED